MLIDGEWVGSADVIEVRNPLDGRLVDTVPRGTVADVDRAIGAAERAAGQGWPTHARYDVLIQRLGLRR